MHFVILSARREMYSFEEKENIFYFGIIEKKFISHDPHIYFVSSANNTENITSLRKIYFLYCKKYLLPVLHFIKLCSIIYKIYKPLLQARANDWPYLQAYWGHIIVNLLVDGTESIQSRYSRMSVEHYS